MLTPPTQGHPGPRPEPLRRGAVAAPPSAQPAVIEAWRYTMIGDFRVNRGAGTSAILTGIVATARKYGDNLLDTLRAIAGPSPLQARVVPTLAVSPRGHRHAIESQTS